MESPARLPCIYPVQTMLYRWIGPPRSFVAGSLFVLMPVAVAVLSYLCLERPVNRWGHRVAGRVRFITLCPLA